MLRKYISSDSRNGGKRGDTAPYPILLLLHPPSPHPPTPVSLDAIFTCGGGEEITVKAREFAFVEISRIPADTTPLFPSSPRPYLPFPSLPPFFRFQTQFVCLRDRISSSDLKCLSKTRKCLSCVFLPPPPPSLYTRSLCFRAFFTFPNNVRTLSSNVQNTFKLSNRKGF